MRGNWTAIQIAPVVCLVILIAVVARMPPFKPAAAPDPPTKPVLALELPREGEVARLLSSRPAKDSATANTRWDYWFIGAYAILFLSIALVHTGKLRVAMVAVALATAAFDIWEDAVIWRFIADPQRPASEIWLPAQIKWLYLFTAQG